MIEVNNLTKYYGDKLGVEGISFSIEKGEIVGLLGPNGAGKSTIMKMINGYMPPSSGSITVNGHDVVKEPAKASADIGFLPEIPPLYTEMAVVEFLIFLAKIRGIPKNQRSEHIDEVMGLANIDHVKDRLIKNLSKGYRQRVGLAQALVGFPEILILDEPTVGLDPKQIAEVRDLIKKLSERHTIILSSHILSEISATCEKIIIINRGKLVAVDTVEGLKNNSSSGKWQAKITAPQSRVLELVAALDEVHSVQMLSQEGESVNIEIIAKPDSDPSRSLFYLCAEQDMPLLGLRSGSSSLEEAFLALTTESIASQEVAV